MSKAEKSPDGMLILSQPVVVPEIWDLLIVGGGPAGTAAAFRARELGVSALVIETDDLMKRIRDYAKDKPILPDFGGGDQMTFPKGGDLVEKLQFGPIQKDEMCRRWKELYQSAGIPAQLGIELLGLERDEQIWIASVWNHNQGQEEAVRARHVVFAVGRGVPRSLDIRGSTAGIARKLTDAARYVSGPVCVIGGGTSAAEAVIAISSAKKKAGEPSDVFWSYRGDQMPKVSRALSDVFFQAYVGNGNIRYLPHSEPVAVVTDAAQQDYLCVRTDRKILTDRPIETVHLEFAKKACIACIGEDLPEPLLNSIGIFRVSGGLRNRKRFVVSPLMETSLPNFYLAGDLLSPIYLQTEDFDADPASFKEVKRRGNIKSALRDGVLVTEVIAQKLAGKSEIRVQVADALPSPKESVGGSREPIATDVPSGRLVRLLDGETTAEEFPLSQDKVVTIGSRGCAVCFPEDSDLAPHQASIRHEDQDYFLTNEGPGNDGVFLLPSEGRPLEVELGAVVKVGQQWLVFDGQPERPELIHYDPQGVEAQRIEIAPGSLVLGRDANVSLDALDSSLSRRHLSITRDSGKLSFTDLGSTNGTWLQVSKPTPIRHGDKILLGQQVLQFVGVAETTPQDEVDFPLQPAREDATSGTDNVPAGEITVTFQESGACLPLRKGQTICELAEQEGIPIKAQCHQGICGSDPVRIVSGHQYLNPAGEGEIDTLEELCGVSGEGYRLACLARPKGPVVVEILED